MMDKWVPNFFRVCDIFHIVVVCVLVFYKQKRSDQVQMISESLLLHLGLSLLQTCLTLHVHVCSYTGT